MIYVSIDIETSGLDHEKNCVLSIGAIIEDTQKKLPYEECPKFNAVILQREIVGSPRALTMNKGLIAMIGEYLEGNDETRFNMDTILNYSFYEKEDVVKKFYEFLWVNGYGEAVPNQLLVTSKIDSNSKPITLNVAGKNFGTFDKLFLQQLPWWQKLIRTRQRVLDPAILCVDWYKDNSLPSLTTCKERTNISGEVTHDALEDAWDVIQVLRKFY
jgi:hypothetical protein